MKFMIEDHKKLNGLLEAFKKEPSKENYKTLKKNVRKHQKAEEKYIFKAFITANEIYDIFKLMKEHKEVIRLIKKMGKKRDCDFSNELKELIIINTKHIKYEEKFLYPKLENLLEKEKKKELFLKIKKYR